LCPALECSLLTKDPTKALTALTSSPFFLHARSKYVSRDSNRVSPEVDVPDEKAEPPENFSDLSNVQPAGSLLLEITPADVAAEEKWWRITVNRGDCVMQ
jgi:hypothetical protein